MAIDIDRAWAHHYQEWTDAIEGMLGVVYMINIGNGWYDGNRTFGDDIALLHSEVSEMFEAYRRDDKSCEKDSMQDEAADIFIRLLDTCYRHDINLTRQFILKCKINAQRGYRYGNKII